MNKEPEVNTQEQLVCCCMGNSGVKKSIKWTKFLERKSSKCQNISKDKVSRISWTSETAFCPFQWQSVIEIKINKTSKQINKVMPEPDPKDPYLLIYIDYFSWWSSSTRRILINTCGGHFQVFVHSLFSHLSFQKLKTDACDTVLMNAHYQ